MMKDFFYILRSLFTGLFVLIVLSAGASALAQSTPSGSSTGFLRGIFQLKTDVANVNSGLATGTEIMPIIINIVNLLLSLVAVLALAALIWGAIMYILSLGDEGRAETAKKIILYAIIGVLVAGVSFLVINVLRGLFVGS